MFIPDEPGDSEIDIEAHIEPVPETINNIASNEHGTAERVGKLIGIAIIWAFIGILIASAFMMAVFSNGMPEKLHMIVTINETGTYVAFETCDDNIINDTYICRIEKYLVTDTLIVETFGAYCSDPMNKPLSYKVGTKIWVAYDSNILANQTVLYGCNRYFVSYRGYMAEKLFLGCVKAFTGFIIGCLILLFACGLLIFCLDIISKLTFRYAGYYPFVLICWHS